MTRSRRSAGSHRDQVGAGLISTVIGVAVFVVLLLFAVQVLVGLYTTSVVTSVTYDAARTVAGSDQGQSRAARADAEATAKRQLGRFAEHVSFDWARSDADAVRLSVRAERQTFVPRRLMSGVGLGPIERTAQVRVEKVR